MQAVVPKRFLPKFWLLLAPGALLLFVSYRIGSPLWSSFSDYSYGWAVPFLCGYLFWNRWTDRPPMVPPAIKPSHWAALGILATLLLPGVMVQEANLLWLDVVWSLVLTATALLLFGLWAAGGRGWVRHLGFPAVFFLVAIPWPGGVEGPFTGLLAKLNAALSVETLSLLGVPALQQGHLVEISSSTVHIDAACSGIRSFHAVLMLALFFGELYRLEFQRRLLLLALGPALALLFNVGRTVALISIADARGLAAMEKWHDLLGTTVLLGCFGALWGVAWAVARRADPGDSVARDRKLRDGNAGDGPCPARLATLKRLGIGLTVWLVLVEIGVEVWYRAHEADHRTIAWSVAPPEASQEKDIRPNVVEMLRFDQGRSDTWVDGESRPWIMYYFRWLPAKSRHAKALIQRATQHQPNACLPASGMRLEKDYGLRNVAASGLHLPIHRYVFMKGAERVFVFHCVWHDRTPAEGVSLIPGAEKAIPRLRSVLTGNRSSDRGLRILELATSGFETFDEAEVALERELKTLIQVQGSPVSEIGIRKSEIGGETGV